MASSTFFMAFASSGTALAIPVNALSGLCVCHGLLRTMRSAEDATSCAGASIPRQGVVAMTSDRTVQGLRQVVDKIVGVLQADRDAQQALRRGAPGPFDGGAMLDQAFDAAQAGGAREQLDPCGHGHRRLPAALHLERQHASEIG